MKIPTFELGRKFEPVHEHTGLYNDAYTDFFDVVIGLLKPNGVGSSLK